MVAFGSRVRGDFRGDSDLDVLVVVDSPSVEDEAGIISVFVKEEEATGVPFEVVIKSLEAYNKEQRYNTAFYRNLLKEGEVFYDAEQRGKEDTIRV